MTDKEKIGNNILIAKFMGWYIDVIKAEPTYDWARLINSNDSNSFGGGRTIDLTGKHKYNTKSFSIHRIWEDFCEYRYETWDDLMPVVDKCFRQLDFEVPDNKYVEKDIVENLLDVNIDGVYKAVIEFIKWYNKIKQND